MERAPGCCLCNSADPQIAAMTDPLLSLSLLPYLNSYPSLFTQGFCRSLVLRGACQRAQQAEQVTRMLAVLPSIRSTPSTHLIPACLLKAFHMSLAPTGTTKGSTGRVGSRCPVRCMCSHAYQVLMSRGADVPMDPSQSSQWLESIWVLGDGISLPLWLQHGAIAASTTP